MAERESKDAKKLKAILRAQHRLKQQLERIDFEEDVVIPRVLAFEAEGKRLELTEKIAEIEE